MDPKDHILIVDDDRELRELLVRYLEKNEFSVTAVKDGREMRQALAAKPIDLIVLDLMLPQEDGLKLCRDLRAQGSASPPILMLTARGDEADRILGLEMGADDYLVKPFSPRELVARVRAILRRTREGPAPQDVFTLGDLEVDLRRREARRAGVVVALTTREFDLLAFLADNVGLALSRQQLLDGVWGTDWYGDERTVDVHVAQLRKKLGSDLPLATVWGVGYRFG